MKTELTLFERTLFLYRYPKRSNDTLQAWDAGDEYLINHVEQLSLTKGSHIVVLNDHFGALSTWFSRDYRVTMMSDSWIAHQATHANLEVNQCPKVTLCSTLDPIPKDADLVLMQIPRTNRHLVWQLAQLRETLSPTIPVIAVNKAKEIHSSTLKLFEKHLGDTTTSLAWKKHRLVFSFANCDTPSPAVAITEWPVPQHGMTLKNHPNVYSGEGLDQGASFFLDHLPDNLGRARALDLGCGNGVLSVKLAQLNPALSITCVDESFSAVASARENLRPYDTGERQIECIANNCLDGFDADSYDVVLCNPPFHQQQTITDHIAWQMFCDAKHVLRVGGQLLVIGNRHLGYDGKLKRVFGKHQVKVIASNKKFVILQATK